MCKVLQISSSTYYYEAKQKPDESELVKILFIYLNQAVIITELAKSK